MGQIHMKTALLEKFYALISQEKMTNGLLIHTIKFQLKGGFFQFFFFLFRYFPCNGNIYTNEIFILLFIVVHFTPKVEFADLRNI